ncbi:MAG: hypothetical protein ABIJ74_02055 [archaeon]
MAEIRKEKNRFFLQLNEKEQKELGESKSLFELSKVKDGVIVLTETKEEIKKETLFDEKTKQLDEKIFELLAEKGKNALPKKVEGTFEKQLNEKELKRFNELLEQGLIEKFKLNESYKKAIYRIVSGKKEKKEFDVNSAAKTIESNGFEVIVNENQVKQFCEQFNSEIKENSIKGTKGFDGYFYVIHSDLLEEIRPKILFQLKQAKTVSLKELNEKTALPSELVRGAMEFLKEEGEVLEKRKGLYQIIE